MSKEVVSVITCTGHRKEAFKLCYQYMKAQTYKGKIQWIIVTDEHDKEAVENFKLALGDDSIELYSAPIQWKKGMNTQRANMLLALSKVKGEKVLFFEDDDFYKPYYIKEMVKLLDIADIVGEGNSKYYHVGVPGWKENHNYAHSSLCQTGIKASLVPLLTEAMNSGNKYFDIELWKLAIKNHVPMLLISELALSVGMKGLPGREGIGSGHKTKDYFLDINLTKIKELLGESASNYSEFIKEPKYERVERDSNGVLQGRAVLSRQRGAGAVSANTSSTKPNTSSTKPNTSSTKPNGSAANKSSNPRGNSEKSARG